MHTDSTPRAPQVSSRSFLRYVVTVSIAGFVLLAIPALTGLPPEPFILVVVFGPLLGGAVLTVRRSGPAKVRTLFSGILRWRIGWGNWALSVLLMPVVTIAIAGVTGTLSSPSNGWLSTAGTYLVSTFLVGALLINLWEEVAWEGLSQRHLMERFGLAKGALLTALPFAVIHLPLGFASGATLTDALVAGALVLVMAPPFRYLLGRLDIASGGSLLAVGVLHASVNASGSLDVLAGGWQHIAGLAVVTLVAFVLDSRRRLTQRRSADASMSGNPEPAGA